MNPTRYDESKTSCFRLVLMVVWLLLPKSEPEPLKKMDLKAAESGAANTNHDQFPHFFPLDHTNRTRTFSRPALLVTSEPKKQFKIKNVKLKKKEATCQSLKQTLS